MKKRIVFFDIDGVIFDGSRFLEDFCIKLSEKLNLSQKENTELRSFYHQIKNERGFFDPEFFLTKISVRFPIAKGDLEKLWWNNASFQDNLLVNENFFKKIQEKVIIGIFSKGEFSFQKKKLDNFKNFINPGNIYIFENKIVRIEEVLSKYRDYEIYMVDDNKNVLENFKKIDSNVITVFIDQESTAAEKFINFKLNSIWDFPRILE